MVAYNRSIALQHGPDNIRATFLRPGWTRTLKAEREMQATALTGTSMEQEFAALSQRIALRRMATPAEMANCVHILASEQARYVTGAVLLGDGGGRVPSSARPLSRRTP